LGARKALAEETEENVTDMEKPQQQHEMGRKQEKTSTECLHKMIVYSGIKPVKIFCC
jgi:hypothetical protein